MHSKSTIRRTMLATLIVLATAAIGLQPSVFNAGSGCTCDARVTAIASVEASCRNKLAEEQEQASCASKPATTTKCCCNPEAAVCECGNCACSAVNDSNSPLPAIPINEKTEVVTPTLICAAPLVAYPRESEIKRVDFPNPVAEHAARSSLQTCVLLSRFTC